MHRYYLKKLPKSFGDFFTLALSVHSRFTRNSLKINQYFIPQVSTNLLQRCIKFKSAKIWNNIPDDLKQKTHNLFKLKYKAHLIHQKN